jgi:PadR family transcriptional regulator PadR
MFSADLKRGSTDLLVLALLEDRARHGYEIGKLIESRSGGRLTYSIPSLYPTLCRLEERGWIKGRWVEKSGERRRRFYHLTREGRRVLSRERQNWRDFITIMTRLARLDPAG